MIPGDFEFHTQHPSGPLGRLVSEVWFARGRTPHRRERILPSPGAVLLVVLGEPLRMTEPEPNAATRELTGAWLSGPHERPILNEPIGEIHAVGAVFEPGGIGCFLDGSVEEIANRIVPVDDSSPCLRPADALVESLRAESDPQAAIETLTRALSASVELSSDHDRWQGIIDALTSPDGPPVANSQATLRVSRRHFVSQVLARVGLRPKSLQRIARLRRLLEELDARKPIRWSEEAVGAGYFDQSHSIRDFKEFTGMTPTEYVRRRRSAWGHDVGPGEATNFVPELIR